jgi:hypothetical protein
MVVRIVTTVARTCGPAPGFAGFGPSSGLHATQMSVTVASTTRRIDNIRQQHPSDARAKTVRNEPPRYSLASNQLFP